eukprot:GDKH01026259.1.p1 GENE.GDKH01026259.1~~GDKH01026259.1.p1  ORF type:complete len:156 (+),score=27.36 GDKH01026259.1:22-489(+)
MQELGDYRNQHQLRYKQRVEEEERKARERADEEVARKLQEEEGVRQEINAASDEAFARALYESEGGHAPADGGGAEQVVAEDADGVRAPMRTNYAERLIDSPANAGGYYDANQRLLGQQPPAAGRSRALTLLWITFTCSLFLLAGILIFDPPKAS